MFGETSRSQTFVRTTQGSYGFTAVELIVSLAAIFLLLYLLVPRAGTKAKAPRINCVSNLKQIGLAFRMWSNDHGERFPMAVSVTETNDGSSEFGLTGEVWKHFQIISNEIHTPKVFACPSDNRKRALDWSDFTGNRHLSYFVGLDADETKPQTILAGDRNVVGGTESATGVITLKAGDRLEWTKTMHKHAGNVALADGSAQQLTSSALIKQFQAALANSGQPTLRLALPK